MRQAAAVAFASIFSAVLAGVLFPGCSRPAPARGRAEVVRVEFPSWVDGLPWEPAPAAVHSGNLTLHGQRDTIGAGRRWAETLAVMEADEATTEGSTLRVSVWDEEDALLAEKRVPVRGARAWVRVDMRTLDRNRARVRCEWLSAGGVRQGLGELWMRAAPSRPVADGTRIAVRTDSEDPDITLDAVPVTFGLPFPEGALWDLSGLRVMDGDGRPLPAQAEPVGWWAEDGAIRWVRVDTLASSPGRLMVEPFAATESIRPAKPVSVTAEPSGWRVDTGAAEYRIEAGGGLIREARQGGIILARTGAARGLYVIDQQGRLGRASAEGADVTVEAAGPVTASIRIEGDYRTEEGEALARHITRLEFHAGRPEVRATHTLVLSRSTREIWFREYGWEFEVQPGEGAQALLNVEDADPEAVMSFPLPPGGTVRLVQEDGRRLGMRPRANRPKDVRWVTRMLGEDRFRVYDAEDAVLAEGERMGDWAAVSGASGVWMVHCRAAAAQHPKDVELADQRMTLRLFSPAAGAEMDFRMESVMERWGLWPLDALDFSMVDGDWQRERLGRVAEHSSDAIGWSKTHEILWSPGPAAVTPALLASQARRYAARVMAHVDPDWIYRSGALGPLHPRDRDRFPEAEAVIDGTFWNHAQRLPGVYTGFFDYFAGPHYGHPGRYRLTYTYLSDMWLAYARSGDRAMRAIAESANRAFMDNYIAHWEGPRKTRGLFLGAGVAAQNTGKTEFPLYWEESTTFSLATTSNLERSLLDYYLTGYRRGGDIVRQYAEGMRTAWSPRQSDWRTLLALRLLAQAYGFTWDPALRGLVEETYFLNPRILDPEGEVGLTKNRPYRSTTYKTPTDMDVFVELGELLGCRHALHVAELLGRHHWERSGVSGRSTGVNAHFLWEASGRPAAMTAGWDHFRRVTGLLLRDPETGETAGLTWSQVARIFQGLPRAMDVLARTGGDREMPAAWMGFSTAVSPVRVFVQKEEDAAVDLLVRGPGGEGRGYTGGALQLRPQARAPREWAGQDLYRVSEVSGGTTTVRLPKDAPGGVFELVCRRPGGYTIFADRRTPLVLHAPDGWRPAALRPPLPVYFRVPAEGTPRIAFEHPVRLFLPDGSPFREGAEVSGWVDLPVEHTGLWHFSAVNPGRIETEALPGFFAWGDPEFYLEAEPLPDGDTGAEEEDDD